MNSGESRCHSGENSFQIDLSIPIATWAQYSQTLIFPKNLVLVLFVGFPKMNFEISYGNQILISFS